MRGQVRNKKLDALQKVTFLRYASTLATMRYLRLSQEVQTIVFSYSERKANIFTSFQLDEMPYNGNPSMKEFNLKVNDQFEVLDARILEPPKLMYADGPVDPNKGIWKLENQFLSPSKGMQKNKWTVLSTDESIKYPEMMDLCKAMTEEGNFFIQNILCFVKILSNFQEPSWE